MKRTFLKFLPIAAAILLATSCSKDNDNNAVVDNVATPDPVQEEVVAPTDKKSITLTGKLSKNSLSKITTSGQNNRTLIFEGGKKEVFDIVSEGDVVSGKITIKDQDGNYEADITYSDESTLTAAAGYQATFGKPTDGEERASLKEAVENANYTIDFVVVADGEGSFSLKQKSDATKDIQVENNSAFIYVRGAVKDDKITFGDDGEISSPAAGKYYIVPAGVKMGTGSNVTVAGKIYNVGTPTFTVSSGSDKVEFSKGNLQYDKTNGKFQFATNQWDYVGTDNIKDGTTGPIIDLFGFGMWLDGMSAEQITSIIEDNAQYQPDLTENEFTNNKTTVDSKEWRTLSSDEWLYITKTRSGTRYSKATVHSVAGLVILPDDWNGGYEFKNNNTPEASFDEIGEADWTILEKQGAVFLPAAGNRDGTSVKNVGSHGYYWSSTAVSSGSYAKDQRVNVDNVLGNSNYLFVGQSVRLVRSL